MKYWGVAQKLWLLEAKQDAEKFNLKLSWIFWIGFTFNFIAGLLAIGVLFVKEDWYYFFVDCSMPLCIFVSCGFLIDAFRILSTKKAVHQVVSKKLATLLSFSFGAYGVALMVYILALAS